MGGVIMKPFNLKEYLANPSKKIVTKDGRKVKRVLCTDAMGFYPIVVLIENYDGTKDDAFQYTKDGIISYANYITTVKVEWEE